MKSALRRLFCWRSVSLLTYLLGMSKISYNNIFSSPSSHLIKDILLLLGDCVFFLKKLETKPFFGGGEGGKEANKVCIMENVQMVNYSLGKRCIYHLESTI